MKKFVLVIICSFILIILMGFNYLLWDRENKERDIESLVTSGVTSSAINSALEERITSLQNDNRIFKDRINDLEASLELLEERNRVLEEEKTENIKAIQQYLLVIESLKEKVGVDFLQEPIVKWIEAINNKDYESAYRFEAMSMSDNGKWITLPEYVNQYRDIIQNIQVKSMNLLTEDVPEQKKGEIIFELELEVIKEEGVDSLSGRFVEGINRKYITVDFERNMNMWVIKRIESIN